MLENIHSPKDIKNMTEAELNSLAAEIRENIIDTVSKNGGHLASNLGIVEATIALHRVFDCPKDKIFFDVSHQSYTHKLLTGRFESFPTLRLEGGISGFTCPDESEYDSVAAGHSGTSLSTALGWAQSAKIKGETYYSVAVIGDGSFTNGMAYEALNNCCGKDLRFIILLNDNEMSISENVGGMHRSLSTIRTSKRYFSFKHRVKRVFSSIPFIGKYLVNAARFVRDLSKRVLTNYNIFESLGCDYIGPVDGHNIQKLTDVLKEAKTKNRCCVVHIITKKGKGYTPAEENPENYHSVPPFDPAKGVEGLTKTDFSSEFGKYMCERAEKDNRVCAVCSAMADGTGLSEFAAKYPDRFFDTAISEEHAATFTAALTGAGMLPVFALYSTFAQRIYDQVFHDAALQKIPLVLAVDRAGIVGADGVTHQGIYDYSLFSGIPTIRIYSPETYKEMRRCFDIAFGGASPAIVRYPRSSEYVYDRSGFSDLGDISVRHPTDAEAAIVTYGRITKNAYFAAMILEKLGIRVRIIKLVQIMPVPYEKIFALTKGVKLVYMLEEGIKSGSVAEKIAAQAAVSGDNGTKFIIRAIEDTFVPHGDTDALFERYGLDAKSIAREIYSNINIKNPKVRRV